MKFYCIIFLFIITNTVVYSQDTQEDTTFLSEKIKRVYETISGMEKGVLEKKGRLNILLNKYPLKGTCDREAYDSLHVMIKHITRKYGKAFSSSNEALEEIFRDEPSRYDILLVLLEVSHESIKQFSTPYGEPVSAKKQQKTQPRYINSEIIKFAAIEVDSRKIVWDCTIQKNEGWFSRGTRKKTNEFTELARLTDKIGFNNYGKKAVYTINAELTKFYKMITK